LILAIDTSTDQASVALSEASEIRAEWSWTAAGNHSKHLTPVIRNLLQLQGVHVTAITSVAVARGPGSFSGLRVGVSEAKGLALALEAPLVGVSTLDVIGYQSSCWGSPVFAVISAGRDEVYLGESREVEGHWEAAGSPEIVRVEEVAARATEQVIIAGPAAVAVAVAMRELDKRARLLPLGWRLRRAGFLAELGEAYFAAGGSSQLDELEPLYLRRSAAEEKRRVRPQR